MDVPTIGKTLVGGALLALLAGCLATGKRIPAWVANPQAAYPEDRYLAAVGEGDTRQAAENAADANLARIFESRIDSSERVVDKSRENDRSLERTTDFTADISILSSQTLCNIRHAEAWKDPAGRIHAVAYIDRRETAALYLDKIREEAARVGFLLAQARKTENPLKRYATLRAALRHAEAGQLLLRQLKTIHPPSADAAAPDYSLERIRSDLSVAAHAIRVRISIEGDDRGRIRSAIEQLVTRYGFVVGTPAQLEITGSISVEDTGQRVSGLAFVRYDLSLRLRQVADGSTILSIRERGREGHISLNEARNRAFRTLENQLQADDKRRLDAYFDSLVAPMPTQAN